MFVDDPAGAVAAADRLVTELMTARGYPIEDFEARAADLSVQHPRVVENYRTARALSIPVAEPLDSCRQPSLARDEREPRPAPADERPIALYRSFFERLLSI